MSGGTRRQASWSEVGDALAELPLSVKATRRARRLSLRQASEQIGCSFNTITRIEHGGGYNARVLPLLFRWMEGA